MGQMGWKLRRPRLRSVSVSTRSLLVGLLLVALAFLHINAIARRKEIDYEALEKSWEADDASPDLQSAADEQYERLNAASETDAKAIGPQMVFVTLHTDESTGELATRWKEMLWNGGVDVNIYEVEPAKVLLGLQKGIFIQELRAFLRGQEEVVEYEWNSKTYQREDPLDTATPRSKKKNKNKSKRSKKNTNKKKHETNRKKETKTNPSINTEL